MRHIITVFFLLLLAGCHRAGPADASLFIGDSITQNWPLAEVDQRAINAGAAAEASIDMLTRARPQMEALRPRMVHILAGTNDHIDTHKFRSVRRVLALGFSARFNGATTIVIGTIPPLDGQKFPMQQANAQRFNTMLALLAKLSGFTIADYNSAMSLPNGEHRPELFLDGIHPNSEGYKVMSAVLAKALTN